MVQHGAFQRHLPELCPLLAIYHQTQAPGSCVYPDVLLHCSDDGPQLLRNKDVSFLLRNIVSLADPKNGKRILKKCFLSAFEGRWPELRCACLGMGIDESFFPVGLLTWDGCTPQLVLLLWENFLWKKKMHYPEHFLQVCILSSLHCWERGHVFGSAIFTLTCAFGAGSVK